VTPLIFGGSCEQEWKFLCWGDSVLSCIGHAKERIMARLARAEIFDPSEIVAVHLIGKTVRSCYLMDFDQRSGKNFDYRKRQFWNDLASSRRFGQPW